MIHRDTGMTVAASGRPIESSRSRLATSVTGLLRATACSQSGIVVTGTNAELTNVSGNSHTKPAVCAVSGSFTAMPMFAMIQLIANPKATAATIITRPQPMPPSKRNPTM